MASVLCKKASACRIQRAFLAYRKRKSIREENLRKVKAAEEAEKKAMAVVAQQMREKSLLSESVVKMLPVPRLAKLPERLPPPAPFVALNPLEKRRQMIASQLAVANPSRLARTRRLPPAQPLLKRTAELPVGTAAPCSYEHSVGAAARSGKLSELPLEHEHNARGELASLHSPHCLEPGRLPPLRSASQGPLPGQTGARAPPCDLLLKDDLQDDPLDYNAKRPVAAGISLAAPRAFPLLGTPQSCSGHLPLNLGGAPQNPGSTARLRCSTSLPPHGLSPHGLPPYRPSDTFRAEDGAEVLTLDSFSLSQQFQHTTAGSLSQPFVTEMSRVGSPGRRRGEHMHALGVVH